VVSWLTTEEVPLFPAGASITRGRCGGSFNDVGSRAAGRSRVERRSRAWDMSDS
jgi:hypothetical protein